MGAADGGEAGLHPSNIHDNAYAIGAIDFTGDMPIILGPDGPSLGGFVCPVVDLQADLWKVGQLSRATRSASSRLDADDARRRPRPARTCDRDFSAPAAPALRAPAGIDARS